MKPTKEEIIKRVTLELDDFFAAGNAEIYDYSERIVDVDLVNQTISIKFDYNIVDEDDYIGLAFY